MDEYDALQHVPREKQSKFNNSMVYTIKHISDNSDRCSSKFIMIGVADTARDLFQKHQTHLMFSLHF